MRKGKGMKWIKRLFAVTMFPMFVVWFIVCMLIAFIGLITGAFYVIYGETEGSVSVWCDRAILPYETLTEWAER
jgi:hypothetical protein